ncbi:pseudouridine synthase [Dethiothermospora halolimnae]|uniref:pseudouridine synthase n=1 Tax=Dethiothermospora halolimnae TaxID=3114390 RepID=UPI003CCBAA5C
MSKLQRIDKILSNMGYGSRKNIKKIMKKGRVTINGDIVKDSSKKIDPYYNKIEIDGILIEYREYIYLMMNKPDGVVSSTDDPINNTVIDLIDDKYKIFEPFPIGRLDKDTEGLLILSNDGKLAHNLLSPKKHVKKTYYVEVEGRVDSGDIEKFNDGVILEDGYKTMAAEMDIIENDDISKVYLTIKEGKFHQVKRMFVAIGKKVLYLKRVSMGNIELDKSLETGEYRELKEEEINLLIE